MKNKILLAFFIFALALTLTPVNQGIARPGGGHSYSSSSSSSSSGSSGSWSSSGGSYSGTGGFDFNGAKLSTKILFAPLIFGVGFALWFMLLGFPILFFLETLLRHFPITNVLLKIILIPASLLGFYSLYKLFGGADYSSMLMLASMPVAINSLRSLLKNKYNSLYIQPFTLKQKLLHNIEYIVQEVRKEDGNFSQPVFLDFVSSLFVKFYEYSDQPEKFYASLAPFVAQSALEEKPNSSVYNVSQVVIGTINISPSDSFNSQKLVVLIKGNYTYTQSTGDAFRVYTNEKWEMRRLTMFSAQPEKMRALQCPVCGAPANFNDSGQCTYCGTLINIGEKQWYVAKIKVLERTEERIDKGLTHYEEDTGYDAFTVAASDLDQKITAFEQKYKVSWPEYFNNLQNSKIIPVFLEIYKAWSENKWLSVRHLMSDRLWESWDFWIQNYRQAGLQNILKKTKIKKIELSNLTMDKFYDSLTVRIFASTKDYVIDAKTGKKIAGYQGAKQFSEYWTFVRYSGIEDKHDIHHCPNCGAPANKTGQTGICEYCGTKITTGQFGWILFRVVQDEEYPV